MPIYKLSTKLICLIALFSTILSWAQNITVTSSLGTSTSANYTTLNGAAGVFSNINNGTHKGVINITINADYTEVNPTDLLKSAAPSSYTSITIKPVGNRIISGPIAASGAVIALLGADNVTIDGDDPLTAGNRNLTIQSLPSVNANLSVIKISSNSLTLIEGATYNTVKNCILVGSRNSTNSTVSNFGILFNNGTVNSIGISYANFGNLIENNEIRRCYYGIITQSADYTPPVAVITIKNNVIGSSILDEEIGNTGIFIQNTSQSSALGSIIQGNDIRILGPTSNAMLYGIRLIQKNSGLQIDRNYIHDIRKLSSNGGFLYGLHVNSDVSSNGVTGIVITNNIICNLKATPVDNSISHAIYGVRVGTGVQTMSGNTVQIPSQEFTNIASACVYVDRVFNNFLNNILVNKVANTGALCLTFGSTLNISSATVNNNCYYAPNVGANVANYLNTTYATLSAWQTGSSKDASAISLDPPFISATDFHINNSIVECLPFYQSGATGTGVSTDFDGGTRASIPCIGADEFVPGAVITLSDNGTQIAASNVASNALNVLLHQSKLTITNAAANLTGMTCSTVGSYASTDVSNLKVWYATSATFNAATASLLSTLASPGIEGLKTFISFTAQSMPLGDGYIYLTIDITNGATNNSTIRIAALNSSHFTFSLASMSGSTTVGGIQTIVSCPGISLAGLTYSANPATYCVNSAIATNDPTLSSSAGSISYSVSTALPLGLTLDPSTGVISGTPNLVVTATNYTITADNGCSNTSAVVQIATIALSNAPTGISGSTSICNGASTTLTATGGTLSTGANYQWGTGSIVGSNLISGQTNAAITVTPTTTTTYWVRIVNGTASCDAATSGVSTAVTVDPLNTWIGPSSFWYTASNWCGGLPLATTPAVIANNAIVTINAGAGNTTQVASLTINSGSTLILAAGEQLTVTGAVVNNGTFIIQDGATFVQATSGTSISGSGTFTVEKALTGNSSTWNSTTSGRFWYMGVPMNSVARSSFGNYDVNANRLWTYSESTKTYTNINNDATTLVSGTGYVHRRATDGTLNFSAIGANGLYCNDYSVSGLTRTSGSSVGFNLISNPYMAYLDWHAVTKTNVESTYYIRSNNSTSNDISALITYNGSSFQLTHNTSLTLTAGQMQYLAPLQAVWVRVGPNSGTGSLAMTRSMLSHQTGNPGLKTSTIFPTLARVNLVDGARFDQMLVFMNQDMSNGVDQYDSEKMFVSGAPQLYTMAAGKKLVMNGLNSNKKKISVPLYLELPQSKVYTLQLADFNLEDGLILLEDKLEGTIQDFTIHDTYAFYANSGVLQNRFVLHFYAPDATITAQGPSNSWVSEEGSYTEGGNILISSDPKGKVQISLDQLETDKVEGMVQVTDANGRMVYSCALEGLTTEFQLNVPAGIYYLMVQTGKSIETKKVFIQE